MHRYWKGADDTEVPFMERAAELGYPPALLRLCHTCPETSEKYQKYKERCNQKKEWFVEQAKSGDALDQYHLGLYYELEKIYDQALEWLQKSADQGYVNGCQFFATKLEKLSMQTPFINRQLKIVLVSCAISFLTLQVFDKKHFASILDAPGEDAWPLTMFTYALATTRSYGNCTEKRETLKYFVWGRKYIVRSLTNSFAGIIGDTLGFTRLPEDVKQMTIDILEIFECGG